MQALFKRMHFIKQATSIVIAGACFFSALDAYSQTKKPTKQPTRRRAPAPLPKPTPYYISPAPTPIPTAPPVFVQPARPVPAVPQQPIMPVAQPTARPAPKEYKPVAGYDRFYYALGIGGRMDQSTKRDTEDINKSKTDTTFALTDFATIGWGTARFYDLYVNAHYTYSQDWGTTYEQMSEGFFKKWFKDYKAENFIFPTKSMLRTHEFTLDARYLVGPIQLGLLSRLWWTRMGSSVFGSDREVENATTMIVGENFVPYLSYRYKRFYQGELAIPLRTELNKDNDLLNNKSYDFTQRGRGRVFSFLFNNRFNFQDIRSILYASAYLYEYKYNAVQMDVTRYGLNLSLDFPVVWKLRAAPRFSFYNDLFFLPRVRIKEPEPEIKRKDTALTFGFLGYIDFNRAHRLKGEFSINSVESTITEHNSNLITFSFGYSWSFPNTLTVARKTERFKNDVYSEEY